MSDDPNVITRRRKKYKFAKFNELTNCFQLDEWRMPEQTGEVVVEIGAGTALFLVELARRCPAKFFIAVDIKSDRLYTGAKLATELGLDNIVFVRSEISHLTEIVPAGSAGEIWLTFSDPYPRKSDARHRLSAPRFLELYKNILRPATSVLHFKTDNQALFDWSVEQLSENGWEIGYLTRDLHRSDAPEEAKIMTTYEQRFMSEGLPIFHLSATIKL
ncbi:MAG: tRNA (guanosine(46)-N7)-methyltransferase TrmB [Candidatus Nomurabacteria bacterium]|nr:tRNA (guanosine(46)-N7)-methyltransferase TrmB [Candidatus Nomurabacteria bacterium]